MNATPVIPPASYRHSVLPDVQTGEQVEVEIEMAEQMEIKQVPEEKKNKMENKEERSITEDNDRTSTRIEGGMTEGGARVEVLDDELILVKVPELADYDLQTGNPVVPIVPTHIDTVVASGRILSTRERFVPFDANPWHPLERAQRNALLPLLNDNSPCDPFTENFSSSLQSSQQQAHHSRGTLTPRVSTPCASVGTSRAGTPLMGVRQIHGKYSLKNNGGDMQQGMQHQQQQRSSLLSDLLRSQSRTNGWKEEENWEDEDEEFERVDTIHVEGGREEWVEMNERWKSQPSTPSLLPNPAEQSLSEYKHHGISEQKPFHRSGHNVHRAGKTRSARKIGRLIGGFGTFVPGGLPTIEKKKKRRKKRRGSRPAVMGLYQGSQK